MTTFLVAIEVEDWQTVPAQGYLEGSLEYMLEVANEERRITSVRVLPHVAPEAEAKVSAAILCLRMARELLKSAGARKTLERVRLALTSAQGAERHAHLAPLRAERPREAGA